MFWQWLENFLHHWKGDWDAEKILIAVLAAAVGTVVMRLIIMVLRWCWHEFLEVLRARKRLRHALWAVSKESPGVWLSSPPQYPENYQHLLANSKPIMTIANLKGGVGKTTIAANLAAHYAYQGERVLFIDLDFQGSSSSMMLGAPQHQDVAARLVDGGGKEVLLTQTEPLTLNWQPPNWGPHQQPQARGIPAFFNLARADNRVMVRWILKDYKTDPRYWLAVALHDPEVQARFDRVIIDAPPRMVTGCIQALCASTCVIIPTILDQLSADAVDRFVSQLHEEKALWPKLKIAGVVGVKGTTQLRETQEKDTIKYLMDKLAGYPEHPQVFERHTFIARNSLLSKSAGQRIVYGEDVNDARHANLRQMFAHLASAIENGLKGQRTHAAWTAWLTNPTPNPTTPATRLNGDGQLHQPMRPL